ncbi:MAG: hypothetical protein ACOYB3_00535 [Azonexus sp.]
MSKTQKLIKSVPICRHCHQKLYYAGQISCHRCGKVQSESLQPDAAELADLLLDGQVDPADLGKRHAVGVEVEGEHTSDPQKKARIARTHEKENPLYYPSKPKPKGKKEALRWVESEGPCQHCGPNYEGRAAELSELGWRQSGWGGDARWTNPPNTYFVHDQILDQLPEDEWDYIKRTTNARLPSDVQGPRPQSKTLGDYENERQSQQDFPGMSHKLAGMDDRADQERAEAADRSFLKNRPKAQVIGDQTTIGL